VGRHQRAQREADHGQRDQHRNGEGQALEPARGRPAEQEGQHQCHLEHLEDQEASRHQQVAQAPAHQHPERHDLVLHDRVGERQRHQGQAQDGPEEQGARRPQAEGADVGDEAHHHQHEQRQEAGQAAGHQQAEAPARRRLRLVVAEHERDQARDAVEDDQPLHQGREQRALGEERGAGGRVLPRERRAHRQGERDRDGGQVGPVPEARPPAQQRRRLREDQEQVHEHRPEERADALPQQDELRLPGRQRLDGEQQVAAQAEQDEAEREQARGRLQWTQHEHDRSSEQEQRLDRGESEREERREAEAVGHRLEAQLLELPVAPDQQAIGAWRTVREMAARLEALGHALPVHGHDLVADPQHAVRGAARADHRNEHGVVLLDRQPGRMS
jgi:hypothetical protein